MGIQPWEQHEIKEKPVVPAKIVFGIGAQDYSASTGGLVKVPVFIEGASYGSHINVHSKDKRIWQVRVMPTFTRGLSLSSGSPIYYDGQGFDELMDVLGLKDSKSLEGQMATAWSDSHQTRSGFVGLSPVPQYDLGGIDLTELLSEKFPELCKIRNNREESFGKHYLPKNKNFLEEYLRSEENPLRIRDKEEKDEFRNIRKKPTSDKWEFKS